MVVHKNSIPAWADLQRYIKPKPAVNQQVTSSGTTPYGNILIADDSLYNKIVIADSIEIHRNENKEPVKIIYRDGDEKLVSMNMIKEILDKYPFPDMSSRFYNYIQEGLDKKLLDLVKKHIN